MANILFIQSILEAVKEGSKAYYTWLKSRKSRRNEACIEAGEKYIQVNENEGEYKELPEVKKTKYLKHFRKRFFKYN